MSVIRGPAANVARITGGVSTCAASRQPLLFKVLAMVAKFEADLIRMRTGRDEGSESKGRLCSRQAVQTGDLPVVHSRLAPTLPTN
jgi:hypothetical protein